MNDTDIPPSGIWPLHPQPWEYETLDRWAERLAAAYSVSNREFCRYALGLPRKDMHRLRTDPPEEVLRRLAAGTAIPIKQLRKMRLGSTMRRCVNEVERLLREEPDAELARWLRGRTAKGYPAAGYQIWDLQNEIFCYLLFSGVSREEFHRELQHVQDYNNDMSD